ncbi:MAG: tRNA glutamyl-Q(34) synthetase GluQRS, partial [Desertimonas sp.]
MTGRFAPSPTGDLHIGNLRTALLAWLVARADAERFLVRMEDLDRSTASVGHEQRQLADLAALGIDWDGGVVRQSERFERYQEALDRLVDAGMTFECFCSRREIREAAAAPHGPGADGGYPGTCRRLSARERDRRRADRPPAIRLRAGGTAAITVADRLAGPVTGFADDIVLRRNDGVPAYQLAVVVDDAAQGVTTVVRGVDLLPSCFAQRTLQGLLDLPTVDYAHVPLVVGPTGQRLAKRDGSVTRAELAAAGVSDRSIVGVLGRSLGLPGDGVATAADLLAGFDLDMVRRLGPEPISWTDL